MTPSVADKPINCYAEDAFTAMLVESGGSLLLSACQANRIVSVALRQWLNEPTELRSAHGRERNFSQDSAFALKKR